MSETDLTTREPKYIFIRNSSNFPTGCIAYSYSKPDGKIRFGYSVYHPGDKFDKKLGRHIAKQRMLKRPRFSWSEPDRSLNMVLYDVCCLLQKEDVSGRFKDSLSHMKRRLMSTKED